MSYIKDLNYVQSTYGTLYEFIINHLERPFSREDYQKWLSTPNNNILGGKVPSSIPLVELSSKVFRYMLSKDYHNVYEELL